MVGKMNERDMDHVLNKLLMNKYENNRRERQNMIWARRKKEAKRASV